MSLKRGDTPNHGNLNEEADDELVEFRVYDLVVSDKSQTANCVSLSQRLLQEGTRFSERFGGLCFF